METDKNEYNNTYFEQFIDIFLDIAKSEPELWWKICITFKRIGIYSLNSYIQLTLKKKFKKQIVKRVWNNLKIFYILPNKIKHGECRIYHIYDNNSTEIYERRHYINGIKQGEYELYENLYHYIISFISEKGMYINNLREGIAYRYDYIGQNTIDGDFNHTMFICDEFYYVKGKIYGDCLSFFPPLSKNIIPGNVQSGSMRSYRYYNINGNIVQYKADFYKNTNIKKEEYEGYTMNYYENGNIKDLKIEYEFEKDKLITKTYTYIKDGEILQSTVFILKFILYLLFLISHLIKLKRKRINL
jgi:hypothetical protein